MAAANASTISIIMIGCSPGFDSLFPRYRCSSMFSFSPRPTRQASFPLSVLLISQRSPIDTQKFGGPQIPIGLFTVVLFELFFGGVSRTTSCRAPFFSIFFPFDISKLKREKESGEKPRECKKGEKRSGKRATVNNPNHFRFPRRVSTRRRPFSRGTERRCHVSGSPAAPGPWSGAAAGVLLVLAGGEEAPQMAGGIERRRRRSSAHGGAARSRAAGRASVDKAPFSRRPNLPRERAGGYASVARAALRSPRGGAIEREKRMQRRPRAKGYIGGREQ
ncbi:hypothetical protein DFH09DRAFT_1478482 [Mycena vulgaris]|nr:hypothetical protein DFH09DRAFT_1478482 [Mycena vulgaris]